MQVGVKKESKIENHTIAYVKDLDAFIQFIIEKRQFGDTDDILLKFGLDKGGGSLKLCLSIAPRNGENSVLYNGVNKVIILAIAYGIPENRYNLKKIVKLLGLTNPFAFGFNA